MSISNELIADIIDDGADYIEKNGWHQGDLFNWTEVHDRRLQQEPSACIMGGLVMANKHKRTGLNRAGMGVIVSKFLQAAPEVHSMSGWNDNVCKTQQEALDLMRTTAKTIRSEA